MSRFGAFVLGLGLLALLTSGCPRFPRAEDDLEPNNAREFATALQAGVPISARAIQGNPDVFRITAGPGGVLLVTLESLGEEDCPAFTVTGPGDSELFADRHSFCGDREFDPPSAVGGAELTSRPEGGYILQIPTELAGEYFVTIRELGEVDNFFDFSWLYRLTATTTD